MIAFQSAVEGKEIKLKELEDKLKPLGYDIGGGWEYDHGYFDYKIDEDNGYTFLRLPFQAIDGELDKRGVTVKLGKPFLLNHKYQEGLDDNPDVFNGLFRMAYNSSFNQFQEPVDKDAEVNQKYMPTARSLIEEMELTLLY
ncbi:YugN-like family protein [Halalkalibacter lacteus]|uniref:YugN-like family protein n=1 Tax=Halalkalibacter lacteus TaxID=3090663 RepID=UPI002FC6EC61